MRRNCSVCYIHVILGQICTGFFFLTGEKSSAFWEGKDAKSICSWVAKRWKCNVGNSPTGVYDASGTELEWDRRLDF